VESLVKKAISEPNQPAPEDKKQPLSEKNLQLNKRNYEFRQEKTDKRD
jgi:hypothetical protein